jgi:hypothetical protein
MRNEKESVFLIQSLNHHPHIELSLLFVLCSKHKHMKFLNKFWIGFLLCIILPTVFGLIYFHSAYQGELPMWNALIETARFNFPLFGKLILLSIFPNLGALFLFYKADYWSACRGAVLATAIFFIISFIYLT